MARGGKDIARDTGALECASCACIGKERFRIRSDTAQVSVDHKQSSPRWQRASTTARSRRPMEHLEMFENKRAWECAHPSADFDFELDQMKEARLTTHGGLRLPTFHESSNKWFSSVNLFERSAQSVRSATWFVSFGRSDSLNGSCCQKASVRCKHSTDSWTACCLGAGPHYFRHDVAHSTRGPRVPWTILERRQGSRGIANVEAAFWRCAHQISAEEVPH